MVKNHLFCCFDALVRPFQVAPDFFDEFGAELGVMRVVGLPVAPPDSLEARDREHTLVDGFIESGKRFSDIVQERSPANDDVVFDELDGFFGVFEEAEAMVGGVLVVVVLDPELGEDEAQQFGLGECVEAAVWVR